LVAGRGDDIVQGAGVAELHLDLNIQPFMAGLAVDLTAGRHDIAAAGVVTASAAAGGLGGVIRDVAGCNRVAGPLRRVHHPGSHQGGVLDDFPVVLVADFRDRACGVPQAGHDVAN
jgi:hypothetical protein